MVAKRIPSTNGLNVEGRFLMKEVKDILRYRV